MIRASGTGLFSIAGVRLGDPGYIHQTVLNAAAALARNPQKGRG
jgi:hypothetical protein